MADAPVGIFDSGFGGLTVARAVLDQLPHEPVLYLKAVNEGIPVISGAPKSAPAERLRRLATLVAGTQAVPVTRAPEAAKSRGLSGLLKRG